MTTRLWLTMSTMALAVSACHPQPAVPAADGSEPAAIVVQTPAPVVTPGPVVNAKAYLAKAGAADLFEIETSQAILKTTTKPDIKAFAQMMIETHEKSRDAVMQAARSAGMAPPPPSLPADRQQQLDGIKAATGEAADKLYLDDQLSIHVEALAIHKSYAADGDNPALRAQAAKIAPMVQQHSDALSRIKRF